MKGKITAGITALLLLAQQSVPFVSTGASDTTATENIVTGDVNCDGEIDRTDLVKLRDYLVGKGTVDADKWQNSDMNSDGVIDSFDLVELRKWIAESDRLAGLVINEVCTSNKGCYQDSFGATPDWVEIYNSSDKAIDLSGVGVSDGNKNRFKFAFPEGTVIPSDSYIIICCDDAVNQAEGEYHASFKISATGETIYLTSPVCGDIDSVEVPAISEDLTYGRYLNGSENFSVLSATPGANNNTSEKLDVIEAPVFSVEGGFYDEQFTLELSDINGNEILYTTDGSDPAVSETAKVYNGGINIYNNTSERNNLSAITDITLQDYSAPSYNVDKGIIIRAVCKTADGTYSNVITNGYYIGKNKSYYDDFKVVSLSTDSDNFFDPDTGIYMVGSEYYEKLASGQVSPTLDKNSSENPTNYNKRGREYEIPVNVQVYENGVLAYTSDVGARISGNWSTGSAQKSIRLYARSEYGDSKMRYEFIEGLTNSKGKIIDEYDKVTLRNGGTEQGLTRFRDILIQRLCADRAVAIQEGEPCIVFIDGEFWGFYHIREKQDADYVEAHYGVDKDNVTFLKNGEIDEGDTAIADEYQEFLNWASTADMTVEANYQRACDTVDIQSLMDYITIETYINNADWATGYMNNWIAWRANTTDETNSYADGKWRFMLYDLDFSSDYYDDGRTLAGFDSLNNLCYDDAPYNFIPLFGNLMNNSNFRKDFYKSYTDIMRENFSPVEVGEKVDEYNAVLGEAINDTNIRFDQEWVNITCDSEIAQLKQYFVDRRNTAKMYLDKFFGIEYDYTAGNDMVNNASGWSFYGSANKSGSGDTFNLTVNKTGVNDWDIQSQSGAFTLENGKYYQLTFEASSTTGAELAYCINHQVGNSWPNATSSSGIALTPQLQRYTYLFYMSADTASNWRLCFNFGKGSGTYTITNVVLAEVNYETELVNEVGSWSLYDAGGNGSMTQNDVNSVTVQTTGLPDNSWENQVFYSGMVFNAGKKYECSYTVKADTEAEMTVHVQQNYGDYTQYANETVTVNGEEKTYTFSFTANSDCIDASICFDCGGAVGTYEISDVSVKCAG